jgi:hypothetical protein
MRTGGMVHKVSVREAMLMRFTEAALKGDTKAAGFLLQRYDVEETENEHASDVTMQDEREFIDAFMQSYAKAGGGEE